MSEDDTIKVLVPHRPSNVQFVGPTDVIGTLHLEHPMRFEGDAEESAKVFFDHVITQVQTRIEELEGALKNIKGQANSEWLRNRNSADYILHQISKRVDAVLEGGGENE